MCLNELQLCSLQTITGMVNSFTRCPSPPLGLSLTCSSTNTNGEKISSSSARRERYKAMKKSCHFNLGDRVLVSRLLAEGRVTAGESHYEPSNCEMSLSKERSAMRALGFQQPIVIGITLFGAYRKR
jgi:hypothetical protein